METVGELARIGEVAERLEVSPRTIKYYEEIGLVEPERTSGGFRLYSERDITRLTKILKMKSIGYSLSAIRELIHAREAAQGATKSTVLGAAVERLSERKREIEARISALEEDLGEARAIERELGRDIELCRKRIPELKAEE